MMIAFKGFNSDLTCTMGAGRFQYRVGETYKTKAAECARAGFHCVEEPIEVQNWYNSPGSRYCIVEALGDIHEDGKDRISCTEIKIVREISRIELALLECKFLQKHPDRECSSRIKKDRGETDRDGFVIVRGKVPVASGKKGDVLFLLKEAPGSSQIKEIAVYEVDGADVKADIYYGTDGKEDMDAEK